jgi:hypothetical protein
LRVNGGNDTRIQNLVNECISTDKSKRCWTKKKTVTPILIKIEVVSKGFQPVAAAFANYRSN